MDVFDRDDAASVADHWLCYLSCKNTLHIFDPFLISCGFWTYQPLPAVENLP
jgi:hypothetical protein